MTTTPTEAPPPRYPRAFVLNRTTDVSGVSGVGIVAEGVEFRDGTVALRWTSAWPTSVVFHDRGIESVEAIHGHNGATRIAWLDNGAARAAADLRDERDALAAALAEVRGDLAEKSSATPGRVTIDVPSVPYPGSRTDAYFFRTAAWNLRNGYDLGGSNLRDTVAVLLDRVATGLDGAPPKPGGRLS